ncbi:MAG: hypothetical protein EA368_12310 [Leptolyngbya sp. DLM2.Bin27]|nr:MAG: hypothetical protein EA368_12310 [Leptolyngbya sp. DLM2.Bin27]
MSTAYYPWNVENLAGWLKLELTYHGSMQALAAALQLPTHVVRAWFQSALPTITLHQVRHIAQYRRWSVQQTLQWLELKPAHVDELMAQAASDRISWDDANAIEFGNPIA